MTRSVLHLEECREARFRADIPEKNDARWLVASRDRGTSGELDLAERALCANRAIAGAA